MQCPGLGYFHWPETIYVYPLASLSATSIGLSILSLCIQVQVLERSFALTHRSRGYKRIEYKESTTMSQNLDPPNHYGVRDKYRTFCFLFRIPERTLYSITKSVFSYTIMITHDHIRDLAKLYKLSVHKQLFSLTKVHVQ